MSRYVFLFALITLTYAARAARKRAANGAAEGKLRAQDEAEKHTGGAPLKNAAFVFIKPHAVTEKVKELTRAGLETKGITIVSEGSLPGAVIDKNKLIDQHYYAIASKATILKPAAFNVPADKFEAQFGLSWQTALDTGKAFNAIDGCEHLGIDADQMDLAWKRAQAANEVVKFGGGFYCGLVEVEGKEPVYIFNGFFMAMRSKFTKPGSEIYWFSVEWDPDALSWADFRGKVVGPTNPAAAPIESLRGNIFANWQDLGLAASPDVGDNSVHASASPFEGFAERNNWLRTAIEEDQFGAALLSAGLSAALMKKWTVDPQVTLDTTGKTGSIFDQLEDLDAAECLDKIVHLAELKSVDDGASSSLEVGRPPMVVRFVRAVRSCFEGLLSFFVGS